MNSETKKKTGIKLPVKGDTCFSDIFSLPPHHYSSSVCSSLFLSIYFAIVIFLFERAITHPNLSSERLILDVICRITSKLPLL